MHKAYNAPSTNFIMALISSCSDLVVVTAIWTVLPCPDQYRRGCGKSATGALFHPGVPPCSTLHPSPFTLHPSSFILHPSAFILALYGNVLATRNPRSLSWAPTYL